MADSLYFLRNWARSPLQVGAIAPSSKKLAREMAALVDIETNLPIIELGPGTGVVTNALLERGVRAELLYSIEFNEDFASHLRARFPQVNIIQGDAYSLKSTLGAAGVDHCAAIISSLPLFTMPVSKRKDLLDQSVDLMREDGSFIQFSYAIVPAFPGARERYRTNASPWIKFNLPPARVWTYQRK